MTQGMAIAITSVRRATQRRTMLCSPVPSTASLSKCKDNWHLPAQMRVSSTSLPSQLYCQLSVKNKKIHKQERLPEGKKKKRRTTHQSHFLLPRGKTPGSMKVAMLKFASTNKNTSPLYTGMAGEMAFVSQGHLWRRKIIGKGSLGCIK